MHKTLVDSELGTLAQFSLPTEAKQVPSRRRIGNRDYAIYTRGADLGTGIGLYVVLPNLAVLVTLMAAVEAGK